MKRLNEHYMRRICKEVSRRTQSITANLHHAYISKLAVHSTEKTLQAIAPTPIIAFGQPPTLIDSGGNAVADDLDSPYLLNVEYQYQFNDFVQFTPGGYALSNPNGDSDNDAIYVGILRTIFRF